MKITPDDPRLTAYALGESDAAERKAIEIALENSQECRRAVEEIAQIAGLLTRELTGEVLPGLTYSQQLAIEAKLKPESGEAETKEISFLIGLLGTNAIKRIAAFTAAVAVISVGLIVAFRSDTQKPTEPKLAASPGAKAATRVESDKGKESDAAFARWAANYRRLQIPLIPLEEVANYMPPEILPFSPAPTIQNNKS
jgi:anti-sigma-K factor RskA